MAPASRGWGTDLWRRFQKHIDKFSRLQGPQPFLRRRQIFIIGLWGEKDDDKLLADDGFLAAVGADGKLRNCSAQQARFARAWHTQDRAAGSVDLPMFFRLQWDAWHSSWLWSAAWIDDDRPRLDGGQSHFDVWPRWLEEMISDGAEAAFSRRKSPEVGEDDPELLWAAGGDGGDDGWLHYPEIVADVQELGRDAAIMKVCATDSALSLASRACLDSDNNEAETRVLQHGSPLNGRRPQVAGHVASCVAESCVPLASRNRHDPKNNGEETQKDVSPPENKRPQVTGQIASCADCCLPLASRICREPKNNGEETEVLQDVSPPESRRPQVGLLQGAVQVPRSTGHCLPRTLLSRLFLTGSFQLPAIASCLQGACNYWLGRCTGAPQVNSASASVRPNSEGGRLSSLQFRLDPTTASESERPRTLVLSL